MCDSEGDETEDGDAEQDPERDAIHSLVGQYGLISGQSHDNFLPLRSRFSGGVFMGGFRGLPDRHPADRGVQGIAGVPPLRYVQPVAKALPATKPIAVPAAA
ncbi:hypothetical protein AB0F30_30180 [Streptomyces sp. NPDC029006]|uniref:hypothetical protein n=1 Tax=Streptomyces sp. NPDC029006 TaxID=3155467 RepID=UPI0033FDE368